MGLAKGRPGEGGCRPPRLPALPIALLPQGQPFLCRKMESVGTVLLLNCCETPGGLLAHSVSAMERVTVAIS